MLGIRKCFLKEFASQVWYVVILWFRVDLGNEFMVGSSCCSMNLWSLMDNIWRDRQVTKV